jgi:hypothetical protein
MKMRSIQNLFSLATIALSASLYVACTTGTTPTDAGDGDGDGDAPTCEADADPCKRNIDCAAGAVCEKEIGAGVDDWGCCKKVLCTADADCADNEICDIRRGLCVPEGLCDPGNPAEKCQPGQFCIYQEGAPLCVDAAALPQPDSCTVSPAVIFVRNGAEITLQATGSLDSGALVPNASFNYGTTGTIGAVGAGTSVFTAACAGPAACTGTVTATSGGATCSADVTVYPSIADGLRVVLFDQGSGTPINGAPVVAKVSGALVEKTTNASGEALFTAGEVTGTVEAVSAFPTTHHWQTVLTPSTNDVAFYTSKLPDATKSAGVKGKFDFDDVSTQGDIKLGLSGISIKSSVVDLDFALLLGEIADYEVEIEGVTDGPQDVPLPSGLVIELGNTPIKPDFVALGDPGRRILWGLGGKVRLADIGPIISSVTASGEDVNIGSILSSVLPFFSKFDHAVVSGLELTEQTRPQPPGEDQPIPYANWPFQALEGANAVKLNTLLSQSANYTVPSLPCDPGAFNAGSCTGSAYQSGAILLTGVIVPGQGIVPLGLTAGLDDPDDQDNNDQVDGEIDSTGTSAPPKGQVILDYAPPHDGLEGNRYITIAIALDIDTLIEGSLAASTIVHVTDSFTTLNAFENGFVQQQGGTFNTAAKTFAMTPVGTADFYRLNLNGAEGAADEDGEWNVYFKTAPGAAIDLASLRPAGITGRDASLDVQAFTLGNGALPAADTPSFDELIEFNGTSFDQNFVYYMSGWASMGCEAATTENPTPFCIAQ